MSDKEKDIIYTARDIEQYLAGKLSPQQMHAMEKAALDDPFLAEAMEGYEAMQNKEWNNQLVALREEIAGKGTIAKVIPLHKSKRNWWKAAAAILIIGSGLSLPFIFNNKKENTPGTQIAEAKTTMPDSIVIPATTPTASVTETLNPSASATIEEKKNLPGSVAKLNDDVKTEDKYIANPTGPQLKPVKSAATIKAPETENAVVAAPPVNNNAASGNANFDLAKEADVEKKAAKQSDEADMLARQKNQSFAKKEKDAVLNNFFYSTGCNNR